MNERPSRSSCQQTDWEGEVRSTFVLIIYTRRNILPDRLTAVDHLHHAKARWTFSRSRVLNEGRFDELEVEMKRWVHEVGIKQGQAFEGSPGRETKSIWEPLAIRWLLPHMLDCATGTLVERQMS